MGLADHTPPKIRPAKTCGIRWATEQMGADDIAVLRSWLADQSIPTAWIAQMLHTELGIDINTQAVARHRRALKGHTNACACPRDEL